MTSDGSTNSTKTYEPLQDDQDTNKQSQILEKQGFTTEVSSMNTGDENENSAGDATGEQYLLDCPEFL